MVSDTCLDHTQAATDALVITGGNVYDQSWAGNSYGKFILGFVYDQTGVNFDYTATGDAEHTVSHPGGIHGKELDGNATSPNGDDLIWSFQAASRDKQ